MKKQRMLGLVISLSFLFLFFIGRTVFSQEPELAPLNPDFVDYQQNLQKGVIPQQVTSEGHGLGFIPSPIDFSYLRGQQITTLQTLLGLSYDPSYDLRSLGKLTPVKNQDGYGTCWAFATYGSLESCLLPAETWDFSENNLANLSGFNIPDPKGLGSWNAGGNFLMSTAYLARWDGPANETDDLYYNSPFHTASPPELPVRKHVQEVLILPDRGGSIDNDNIKQAVMTYGAVWTTMCATGNMLSDISDSFYSDTTYAYYYNGSVPLNHAVCIVGWDDNFPKTKFNTAPPDNGAFIVRNSWGTGWGDNGYFYVSYYDSIFGNGKGRNANAVFDNAEADTNYQKIYQYDPLGWIASVGYGSNTGWFSNIFTAPSNQLLKAVSFYTASINSPYEIYVYTNATSGQPTSGTHAATKTGTIVMTGYHTIVLDSPVSVISGQRFSIVVKLTTPGFNYPIPIERPLSGYSSKATANAGESFISSNGSAWSDITGYFANTNVCLKAFSSIVTHTITASTGLHGNIIPSGVVTVSEGDAPAFTFTPNSGYYLFSLLVDGARVDTQNGIRTSYTFAPVIADHTIAVTFAIDKFIVSASVSGGHGTVSPASQSVAYNSPASVTITPALGYHIAGITDNGSPATIASPYLLTKVIAAHVVVVTFAIDKFTVSASVSGGHGTVSPASQDISYGGTATIAITPEAHYYLDGINDNGTPMSLPTDRTKYVITNVTAAHNVVLTFALQGDVNNDDVINITDVILCLRQAIGLDSINPALMDMNGDGVVNITDVILILRKAIGLDAKTRAEISERLSG